MLVIVVSYCQLLQAFSSQTFHHEHIIPSFKGGSDNLDNIAFACGACNPSKGIKTEDYDPFTQKLVPLYHPRQQKWKEHFAWNEDYILLIGLSPTGRATINALKMNRPNLQNLRRVLRMAGEHPPIEDTEK